MSKFVTKIEEMTRLLLNSKLRFAAGQKIFFASSNIEPDGRKRKGVIKELQNLRYLGPETADPASSSGRMQCEILERAYLDIQAIPVNLAATWGRQRGDFGKGVLRGVSLRCMSLRRLSDYEVKYLLENKGDYTFYVSKIRDFMNGIGEPVMEPFVPGTGDYFRIVDGWTDHKKGRYPDVEVVVCNAALDAHIDKVLRDESVEAAMNRNLSWGLVKLGLLDGNNKDVAVSNMPSFGDSDNMATFPEDYNKWAELLPQEIEQTQQRLQDVERKLQNLSLLAANLESYGGWEKFLADYRGAVEASLNAKEKVA